MKELTGVRNIQQIAYTWTKLDARFPLFFIRFHGIIHCRLVTSEKEMPAWNEMFAYNFLLPRSYTTYRSPSTSLIFFFQIAPEWDRDTELFNNVLAVCSIGEPSEKNKEFKGINNSKHIKTWKEEKLFFPLSHFLLLTWNENVRFQGTPWALPRTAFFLYKSIRL